MSTDTIVTVLTGLGVLVAIFAALAGFFFSIRGEVRALDESVSREIGELRTEMRAGDESLRQEISELRTEMRADYRSLNDRIDGTNTRIDRLADSLRAPLPA